MEIIAAVFVGIVALEHVFIMILEMFFINSKAAKRSFKLPKHLEGDRNVAVMFANQGLYNGFLAAGLIWGLILGADPIGHMIQMFFVICVVIAAHFRRLYFKQINYRKTRTSGCFSAYFSFIGVADGKRASGKEALFFYSVLKIIPYMHQFHAN